MTTHAAVSGDATVASHLFTNLDIHSNRLLNIPFLHPYAPKTVKGKEKAINLDGQALLLEQSSATIRNARTILEAKNDPARTRLVLALREISEHQVPPSTLRASQPSTLTSPLASLPPLELLRHLASKLSIQAYIEDSQFGLLKQSLALAGKAFVIDIDLETDPVEGEDDGEIAVGPSTSGVRLSKLTANHVNGDSTGKSDWIAKVLKDKIGAYLEAWNARDKVTEAIASLEHEFLDLSELDALTGANWFLELETVASEVQSRLYPDRPTIYPTVALLPESELFRIRPGPTQPGRSDWINTDWVLVHVRKSTSFAEGVVVGRHWLNGTESNARPWDGSVRMEQLLTQLAADRMGRPNTFAYAADYVHGTQHWAMAEPGPVGFVAGRIKVPRVRDEFLRVLELLREQLVLNMMIARVFTPEAVGAQGDAEDILSNAIPLTVTLGDRKVTISLPMLAVPEVDTVLVLTIRPSPTMPFINVELETLGQVGAEVTRALYEAVGGVNGSGSMIDLIEVIRRIEVVLSGTG